MRFSQEHDRVVRLIKESISLMCKTSLNYDIELNVEGLLGITLDKKDIFLVNINESFSNTPAEELVAKTRGEALLRKTRKRSTSSDDHAEIAAHWKADHEDSRGTNSRRRRSHKRLRGQHQQNSPESLEDHGNQPTEITGTPGKSGSTEVEVKQEPGEFEFDVSMVDDTESCNQPHEDDGAKVSLESVAMQSSMHSETGQQQSSEMVPDFSSPGVSEEDSQPGDDLQSDAAFNATFDYPSVSTNSPRKGLLAVDSHGGKICTCRYCEEIFSSVPLLIKHEQKVHNHPWFSCTYTDCDKTFQTKSALMRHHKMHSGQGFTCSVCQKVFPTRSDLRNHSWIHDSTKFPCRLCGKIFNHPRSVMSHEKKWHS